MVKRKKARKEPKAADIKDLGVKHDAGADTVAGGRKAGTGQQDYLIVKMNDIQITS